MRFTSDDRAVSRQVGYILAITITTILIGGLLTTAGTMVDERQDTAAKSVMRVAGDRLTSQLMTAEQIADSGTTSSFSMTATLPKRAGGSQYNIEVVIDDPSPPGSADDYLRLTTDDIEVVVPMEIDSSGASVQETTVTSGTIEISYSGGDVQLS